MQECAPSAALVLEVAPSAALVLDAMLAVAAIYALRVYLIQGEEDGSVGGRGGLEVDHGGGEADEEVEEVDPET
ncbi:hypothetical protein ABZP36_002980 [Zizania latifolia]